MSKYLKSLSFAFLSLFGCTPLFAGPVTEPVELKAGCFSMRFSADGRPASFKTIPDGKELLNTLQPGRGFYLKCKGNDVIPMQNISMKDGKLVISAEFGTPEITFSVKQAQNYLAFRIERLKSVSIQNDLSLHFRMNTAGRIRAMDIDYMTDVSDSGNCVTVDWNFLSHRHPDNPLGGFVLFYGENEDAEDDAVLHIWAEENLAHPKVQGPWSYEMEKKWIARWQKTFADQSRLWLEASSLDELYQGAEYAQKADIKEIFLFINTWRGEPFWPERALNWEINRKVFPEGEKDVRKYSDYLRSKGINLLFHYVSGGMGYYDPKYIGNKPDRRLASWGSGKLAGDVNGSDAVIRFIPDQGVELPYRLPTNSWGTLPCKSYALANYFDYETMRINDELIKVGRFDDTDKPVWILRDCERGLYDTDAVSHSDGEEMAGIITTFGINFIPDNDSTLLREIAENFAGMLNRCGVSNAEFDGAEIHTYNGRMWGYHKFATIVYQNIDHPIISNSSSAVPAPCFIEHRLNSSLKLKGRAGYHGYGAPILLDKPSREAGSLLDAQWALCLHAVQNFRRFNVAKPEPLFGVSIEAFKTLGITDQILETVRNWKAASNLMTEEQKQEILTTLSLPPSAIAPSDHPAGPIVHTVRKSGDGYEIVPVKILTREKGDSLWRAGQEHGPVSPKQYVKPGEELVLNNIYEPQPAKFIIRVLWAMDYANQQNILLQPECDEIKDRRDITFGQEEKALTLSCANIRSEAFWETREKSLLPWWSRKVDMTTHRGIGMYVTGDDSNSVLVFQIPGRDYVVPITFKGRKYIEIPNGEAAWANGYWGWRMGSKQTDYNSVDKLKLGMGYLPPQTRVNVKVEGIQALNEISTELVNPIIHTGLGELKVTGTVASGQYLEYKGGSKATVYDRNWNIIKEVPVKPVNYTAPNGWTKYSITTSQQKPLPWLEVQFMTEGKPMVVPQAAQQHSLAPPFRASSEDLRWFRDAKFGMFVHWGPVSLTGGELGWCRDAKRPFDVGDGKGPTESGTWTELIVPKENYDCLYKQFNPTKFNANEWVKIAKNTGMKYIVFTTKHHDGFSNFFTKYSDYSIANSPFKRDIVKELADACHKGGLKFGVYYSPRDWYHPDYLQGDNGKYNQFMTGQIRELLTNYGKIDIIWFDSVGVSDLQKDWQLSELITMIRHLQPGILINNRLAVLGSYNEGPKEFWGDFDTPEQKIGKYQIDRPWESCITLVGEQWSWKPKGKMFTFKECIDKLVMSACGDGNLLLNVGPMPTGQIEARQIDRLKEIGDWLAKYGSKIYGTRGGPFGPGNWGGSTHKGNLVYLHIISWPQQTLRLPSMNFKIMASRNVTGGKVECKQTAESIEISVPQNDRNAIDTIIELQTDL